MYLLKKYKFVPARTLIAVKLFRYRNTRCLFPCEWCAWHLVTPQMHFCPHINLTGKQRLKINLLYNRFTAHFCCCWLAVPGFDSRFLCEVSFFFFPKSIATHRNHMKCVCALFILVLVVQIVHTKKPPSTSKQNKAQIYVRTVQGPSP